MIGLHSLCPDIGQPSWASVQLQSRFSVTAACDQFLLLLLCIAMRQVAAVELITFHEVSASAGLGYVGHEGCIEAHKDVNLLHFVNIKVNRVCGCLRMLWRARNRRKAQPLQATKGRYGGHEAHLMVLVVQRARSPERLPAPHLVCASFAERLSMLPLGRTLTEFLLTLLLVGSSSAVCLLTRSPCPCSSPEACRRFEKGKGHKNFLAPLS